MDTTLIIAGFFAAGLIVLVADVFLPSHGILTVVSLGLLAYGVYLTFGLSPAAGFTSIGGLLVVVPSILFVAVRNWHRTPIGRRISPPNPVLAESDRMPVESLRALVGVRGRSVTPLRPVGVCLIDGQRLECMSENGMLSANTPVEVVRLADRTLVVRPVGAAETK